MINSEVWTDTIARNLVGGNVIPVLFNAHTKESRKLPIDRFAFDDDGYYLVNARLRIPAKAILLQRYNPARKEVLLKLNEHSLEERRLYGITWQ